MKRLLGMIAPFAGSILFFAINAIAGLKPAIAATVALVIVELFWRWWRRRAPDHLFLVLAAISVTLGLIDLALSSPMLVLYEGVATNTIMAVLFAGGAIRQRPLVQDFAERAAGRSFADEPGIVRFFRAFTWAWAIYFAIRALFCFATAMILPLQSALAARAVFAGVTMIVMVAFSIRGREVYFWCVRRGWLPSSSSERAIHSAASASEGDK